MNLHTTRGVDYIPLPETIDPDREMAMQHIAEAVHRVNEAVYRAVRCGVSVELVRTSRCHDECGNWGDQMTPAIRQDDSAFSRH